MAVGWCWGGLCRARSFQRMKGLAPMKRHGNGERARTHRRSGRSYALDSFFGCELLQALKSRQANESEYVAAAPMLYESKHDGTLAAHATQENLRLVRGADGVETVRHDHSIARALNRGDDIAEGEQKSFIEVRGRARRLRPVGRVGARRPRVVVVRAAGAAGEPARPRARRLRALGRLPQLPSRVGQVGQV